MSSSVIKSNTRSISYRAIRPYVAEDELTGRQMPRSKQLLGAAGSNVRPAFWRYHEKMSEEPQASRLEALVLAARLCFLRRSAFYILLYIYDYIYNIYDYMYLYLSRGQTMKCDFVFKLQDGQALPYQLPVVLFRHTGTIWLWHTQFSGVGIRPHPLHHDDPCCFSERPGSLLQSLDSWSW